MPAIPHMARSLSRPPVTWGASCFTTLPPLGGASFRVLAWSS
jgi:hypothetical protein